MTVRIGGGYGFHDNPGIKVVLGTTFTPVARPLSMDIKVLRRGTHMQAHPANPIPC